MQKNDLKKLLYYLHTDSQLVSGMRYFIYDTREKKQQSDPNHSISRASARFNEYAIYRYWQPGENPSFPHELTHLVAHKWGKSYEYTTELDTASGERIIKRMDMVSTSFMQEGLAIAVDEILFVRMLNENGVEKYVDAFCRDAGDNLPKSLQEVINFEGFCRLPNEIVVPFTASLSKYLLGKYGLPKYKQMYVQIKETNSPQENVSIIEKITEQRGEDILNSWRSNVLK